MHKNPLNGYRLFERRDLESLIICPKNLVPMWEDYRLKYRLRAKVLSITRVEKELPDLRRFRQVIIDESHNLRNREGKRYRAINEYLSSNDSKVILLSATPYNKTYLDLSNQLRLFIDEREDIGVRPERLLRELGETEFIRSLIDSAKSLSARVTYGRSHLPGATIGDYTNSFADGNSLSAGDGLRQISTE